MCCRVDRRRSQFGKACFNVKRRRSASLGQIRRSLELQKELTRLSQKKKNNAKTKMLFISFLFLSLVFIIIIYFFLCPSSFFILRSSVFLRALFLLFFIFLVSLHELGLRDLFRQARRNGNVSFHAANARKRRTAGALHRADERKKSGHGRPVFFSRFLDRSTS